MATGEWTRGKGGSFNSSQAYLDCVKDVKERIDMLRDAEPIARSIVRILAYERGLAPEGGLVGPELELVECYGDLGPNAKQVLLQLARRLRKGVTIGDFQQSRAWGAEAQEELIDGMVYLAVENQTRISGNVGPST